MALYVVGYDLKEGQDYEPLIDRLKQFENWWHHLDSTWVIKSSTSATEVRDALQRFIYDGDEMLVIDATGGLGAWTGFNEKGSKWLKDALESSL
jgi:hypothetical protein